MPIFETILNITQQRRGHKSYFELSIANNPNLFLVVQHIPLKTGTNFLPIGPALACLPPVVVYQTQMFLEMLWVGSEVQIRQYHILLELRITDVLLVVEGPVSFDGGKVVIVPEHSHVASDRHQQLKPRIQTHPHPNSYLPQMHVRLHRLPPLLHRFHPDYNICNKHK